MLSPSCPGSAGYIVASGTCGTSDSFGRNLSVVLQRAAVCACLSSRSFSVRIVSIILMNSSWTRSSGV